MKPQIKMIKTAALIPYVMNSRTHSEQQVAQIAASLVNIDPTVVLVPFNPTAENMAEHLVKVVAPQQLAGTGIVLTRCKIEETAKCSATFAI